MTRSEMRDAAGIAPADPETPPDTFYSWLADREAACDYVLCRCERGAREWTRYCNGQADLVLFISLPEGEGPSEEDDRQVEHCREKGARAELVLLQSTAEPCPGERQRGPIRRSLGLITIWRLTTTGTTRDWCAGFRASPGDWFSAEAAHGALRILASFGPCWKTRSRSTGSEVPAWAQSLRRNTQRV